MTPQEIENILYRENLQLASVSKRATAFFLDELLLSLLLIVSIWGSFSNAKDMTEMILLIQQFTLEYIVLKVLYQMFFVYKYGATLGKIAMKIKVVELETLANPSIASSLNRAVFRIISEMLFYMGFLWGMFDPFKRTWHDLTAKTIVIES
jgi:uncharacterized RDD family membrane protein YckC